MKKKFPPPSHRPIPTRDKKQKRKAGEVSPKASRKKEDDEELFAIAKKRDNILRLRAKREKLVPIDRSKLTSANFMGGGFEIPTLERKYYLDYPFTCVGCQSAQVWTGLQQKWWFEVAGGAMEQIAIRCRDCRIKERTRKSEARKVHLEGMEKKLLARANMEHLTKRKRKRPGNW